MKKNTLLVIVVGGIVQQIRAPRPGEANVYVQDFDLGSREAVLISKHTIDPITEDELREELRKDARGRH